MTSRIDERNAVDQSGASFKLLGSTLTLKLTAADTDGAYSLIEYDTPPGQLGSPTHRHEQTEEYIFVLAGELSIVLEGEEIVAGPGEGILMPRGAVHSFANQSSGPVRFLTLLRPGGFEELLATVANLQAAGGWDPTPEEFAAILAPYDIVITDHDHEA